MPIHSAMTDATPSVPVKREREPSERPDANVPASVPLQKVGKNTNNPVGSLANTRSECIHHVEVPKDWQDSRDIDGEKHGTLQHPHFDASDYAKQYPFKLDPFQATAVACIERGESVMVAAHTSAGKTVVAEYAIAKALAGKQRVVYTSPLKALSNQKFRELSDEFGDVGLMTGDVTLNEDASCIVMTTEILRSMLYRGSEMMREIVWVIFDEIHYMQDRDRGVVWEETIIGLPRACRMAFLSATLANATEFAGWVAMLHEQPCHVVYTEFRPTPLEHFGLPCTEGSKEGRKGGLYKVFTQEGQFVARMWEDLSAAGMLKEPWQNKGDGDAAAAAAEELNSKQQAAKPKRATGMVGERIADLMELVQQRKLYPIIVFSFNRLECETFAMDIFNRGGNSGGTALDFTTEEEKAQIDMIFSNAIEELGEDKELPAVQKIKRFLERGIGFHHGGLIPLVKELVEILFQEGLVKVLFATETFAMGLNMPARTVLFTTYFKSDGVTTRALTSGEYIQMSGRAGRRGKDARGYVIILIEDPDKFSPAVARALISGKPMPLLSRFRLSYYTLLNLSKRREGGLDHMDYLIAHSFQQYQHDRQVPRLQARVDAIEAQLAAPEAQGLKVDSFDEYVQLKEQRGMHAAVVQAAVMAKPAKLRPFLAPGRLVRVQEGSTDWGWGVVLKQPELKLIGGQEPGTDTAEGDKAASKVAANWQLPVMLAVSKSAKAGNSMLPAPLDSADADMQALPVPMPLIVALAGQKLALDRDLRTEQAKRRVHDALKELVLAALQVRSGGADAVPTLHPIQDLNVKAAGVESALQKMEELDKQLQGNELMKQEGTKEAKLFRHLQDLAIERGGLQAAIAQSQLTDFREEVSKRRKVLLRLGHVTEDGLLTVKGKAAAEIDTADELMTTELMFNAVWQQLKAPALLVALLSCLVPCTEKERSSEAQVRLPLLLAQTYKTMQDFAARIAAISNECGIEVDPEQYGAGFTANLMVPLYTWARGATFAEVTSKTSIYEGTLIRCARRLTELMYQIIYAADKVGEVEMKAQVEAALACLQRGIMFTGSLYLSGS